MVAGEYTDVFAYAPDRIARDPLDLLNFCRVCENAGVQIHFVVGPSGNDEYTQLIRFVTGFAGHQERAMIARRTIAGKWEVARGGRMPNGTGKGFYGYDYNPVKKERTVNEIEANVVRRMFRDVAAGKSAYRVAVELNEEGILTKTGCKWYSISVERILENTAYFGMNYYGRTKTYKDKDGRRKTVERPKEEWVQMWGYTPRHHTRVSLQVGTGANWQTNRSQRAHYAVFSVGAPAMRGVRDAAVRSFPMGKTSKIQV